MAHQTRLIPLHDDRKPEINVFVHGLCLDGPFPNRDYLKSDVNDAELRGKVYLFHWKSGCRIPLNVPFVAAAAAYITRAGKARTMARSLQRALISRRLTKLPMTLYGYSLGARVLAHFLDSVAQDQFNIRRVVLLGGAVASNTQDWNERAAKVSKEIINVYAPRDRVIKWAKDLMYFSEGPAGLTGIQSTRWKIRDVRLRTSDHQEYLRNFSWVLSKIVPNRRRSLRYRGDIVVECRTRGCDERHWIVPATSQENCDWCGKPLKITSDW